MPLTPIDLRIAFDPALIRTALRHPLRPRRSTPNWLVVLGSALLGAAGVVVLRLGLGVEQPVGYIAAAAIGALGMHYWWLLVSNRALQTAVDALATLYTAEDEMHARFSAEGAEVWSPNSRSWIGWPLITAIEKLPGGSALLFGATRLAIPDDCLPASLSPEGFRAQLLEWQKAGA